MSYPRNAASPEPVDIGAVVQISDGAVQTSGVTVRIKPKGVAEADGGGAVAYSTDGIVIYTPTQAETDYTSFILIAKKTGCIPASKTVVTSASATAGYAGTDQSKIANPTSTVNLSGTTIKNSTDVKTIVDLIYTVVQLTDADVSSIVTTLGTPAGASLAADLAAAKVVIDSISAALAAGVELDSPTVTKIDQILEDTGTTLPAAIAAIEGGGGSATLEKQEEILAAIQGTEVIQAASPNVQGNLVLTQGDSYDGIANPKASWTVTTDYTDGWSVMLTIRGEDDAVIYATAGTVVSATVVAVQIASPTGLTMSGCPGQWQGKFDVELSKAGSKKTIALGTCYINEDQTR